MTTNWSSITGAGTGSFGRQIICLRDGEQRTQRLSLQQPFYHCRFNQWDLREDADKCKVPIPSIRSHT
eukprot:4892298-Amphidinium_carterae.3